MIRLWIVALSIATLGSAEIAWLSQARLKNPEDYFTHVMQETVLELEKKEWCNFKLPNISQTLNEQMYDWLVAGNVNYTDGFVVSIQKIDLSKNINVFILTRTINDTTTNQATIGGFLNFRDVEIGFDVVVNLNGEVENRHFTGAFTYLSIQIEIYITKNLHLESLTVGSWLDGIGNGGRKMLYMPANNLTEVLSRRYEPDAIWNGVSTEWVQNIIAPTVLEVAKRTPFPEVCFNSC